MAVPNWVYSELAFLKVNKNGFYVLRSAENEIEQLQRKTATEIKLYKSRIDEEIRKLKANAIWKKSLYKDLKLPPTQRAAKFAKIESSANAQTKKLKASFEKFKSQHEAQLKKETEFIVLKYKSGG